MTSARARALVAFQQLGKLRHRGAGVTRSFIFPSWVFPSTFAVADGKEQHSQLPPKLVAGPRVLPRSISTPKRVPGLVPPRRGDFS